MSTGEAPTVVYIGGYRRSGSTLLGILLGEASDFVHVGELSFLGAEYTSSQRAACACGRTPADCDFWTSVAKEYEGEFGGDLADERTWHAQRRFERRRGWAPLLSARAFGGGELDLYRRHVRALYRSLGVQEGTSFVVDSSKCMSPVAWRPILLHRLGGIDVRLIHLVRDGRGVMWSARKGSNRSLELGSAANSSAQIRSWNALFGWTVSNAITTIQRTFLPQGHDLVVRYRDLASDPVAELERIGSWLEADLSDVVSTLEAGEGIPARHEVGGNRVRHGEISAIEPDLAWTRRLPERDRMLYRLLPLSRVVEPSPD